MWLGRLPNSVCRMRPFLKLNLLMRPGNVFECKRLPIVAVLFVTCPSRLWTGRLRLWLLCLPNVAVMFTNLFSECVVTRDFQVSGRQDHVPTLRNSKQATSFSVPQPLRRLKPAQAELRLDVGPTCGT